MKKILSVFIVAAIVISLFALPAFADEGDLPFELVAPAYVTAEWLEGGDSPTTTYLSYSLSNEMTAFFKNMENAHSDGTIDRFMENVGCDDIWMNVQIDWAVDDVNDAVSGWHYTKYWDGNEYFGLGKDDEGHARFSEWDVVECGLNNATETVQDVWVTRGVPNDDRWNGDPEGYWPGVKDQLRPDQYTYNEEEEELRIDYTKHTVYFRARFVVTVRSEGIPDRFYFSDWSETACVGKDSEKFEPLTKADLDAPVITGLRMTDKEFNGNPIVAFTLTVPDRLMENATKVAAKGGGIVIEVWARVKGDTEFVELQGDWIIKAGEMESALFSLANENRPNVPKDSVIELRCRYRYDHPKYFDGFIYSDWSKTIAFGTDDIAYNTAPAASDTAPASSGADPAPGNNDKCPICHFCPQPLGLCIFIWLAIIVAIAVVVIIIVKSAKKNENKEKKEN
ncbi:MAG: hypothetical protein IJV00_07850 [Clostridia bacterium]|nr:hypothetical protein [Clostridia bacterium]